jgi:hypothetical protein
LPTKAEAETVEEIEHLMKEMPKREEVQQVRTDLFGSMQQFTEDNNIFKEEHKKQTEILSRYDEVITLKCSM